MQVFNVHYAHKRTGSQRRTRKALKARRPCPAVRRGEHDRCPFRVHGTSRSRPASSGDTPSPPSPLRCATIFRARAEPRRYKVLAALGVTAPRTGSPPLRGKGQNSESSSRKSTTPMFNTPFSSYQRFLMSCRTTILGKESPINPKGLVSASILLSFSIA